MKKLKKKVWLNLACTVEMKIIRIGKPPALPGRLSTVLLLRQSSINRLICQWKGRMPAVYFFEKAADDSVQTFGWCFFSRLLSASHEMMRRSADASGEIVRRDAEERRKEHVISAVKTTPFRGFQYLPPWAVLSFKPPVLPVVLTFSQARKKLLCWERT